VSAAFQAWLGQTQNDVERALERFVPADAPAGTGEAMRYAVLEGGKRLRPALVLAVAQAVGEANDLAMRAGCAAELIHAYSLVHDDMPCMDNDVLRRGKATVHVRFGEAMALLAGDALQALAFELLTPETQNPSELAAQARLCATLARAAGHSGMAGGQAIDLTSVGSALTEPQLAQMHRLKTGALLHASVAMGLICAGVSRPADAATQDALNRYGWALGLAFQVVDDILDVVGDTASLGKTIGKDAANDKPTYVSLLGLDGARARAKALHEQARSALAPLSHNTQTLHDLADWVVARSY
jgi:farnesyl diphosphate synthase